MTATYVIRGTPLVVEEPTGLVDAADVLEEVN
jgi:hypothetical protein